MFFFVFSIYFGLIVQYSIGEKSGDPHVIRTKGQNEAMECRYLSRVLRQQISRYVKKACNVKQQIEREAG